MLKKGVEALLDPIKEIILALIVFGALVTIVLMLILPSGIIASEWSCKTSVAWASGTFGIAKKLGFDSISCFTDDVKSDAKQNKEALNDIAEYMRKCWNMWGEGNLNPEGKNMFYGAQEKCFTCYRINFPELEESVSMEEIYNYLEEGRDYNKLGREKTSYWNYFKKSNPSNFVDIILPGDVNNVIKKKEFYAVTYTEDVNPSIMGHLVKGTVVGSAVGTSICVIGSLSGLFTAPSLLVCGALGAGSAVTGDLAYTKIEETWHKIKGKGIADGITFTTYDSAKNVCVTVVRAGEEININEAVK